MDMTEKKKEILWLFPDNAADKLPIVGLFEGCENEISKNGATSFPVITIDSAGTKYKVSRWKTACNKCIEAFGNSKSDAWIGKQVKIQLNDHGNGFVLLPVLEQVA